MAIEIPDAAGTTISAAMMEEIRLKSHWKVITGKGDTVADGGAAIWTLSNPSVLVCDVGSALQDDGSWKPDTPVAAAIVGAHNAALIHPDAGKVRSAGQKFLHSVRVAGKLKEIACKDHLRMAADDFSAIINNRKA